MTPFSVIARSCVAFSFSAIVGAFCCFPVANAAEGEAEKKAEESDAKVSEIVVIDKKVEPEGTAESGYRNSTGLVGPLGKRSLKDTPYSLNVTSGELIANSNAHSVADAVKTNPTVTSIMSSSGYSSMSRLMARGFSASDQNEQRDGMADRSWTWVPLENIERIEVFNGLNGFLTGFGSPGGTVNYVSKKPTDKPLESLTTGVYNGAVGFAHADLGGRVAATDDRFGYRVNLYREGGDTYTDGSTQERTFVSGYFDMRLAPDTKVWTDIWHQNYHATGISPLIMPANWATQGVPDASMFDATKQLGQDWTYNKSEKTEAGIGLDTKLNDMLSARIGYRHVYEWRDFATVFDVVQPDNQTYKQYYVRAERSREVNNSGYAMLDAKFDTFGLGHQLTTGYNGTSYYFTRGLFVPGNLGTSGQLLGTSSISSPAAFADPDLALSGDKTRFNPVRWNNLLLGDVVTINDQWSVLAGITHARYSTKQDDWGVTPATLKTYPTLSRASASADTPSVGLMFKPVPSTTTYASYMELLEVNTAPSGTANAGTVMSPNISKQYELGVKTTIGGMNLNTALFRIEKANAYTDPDDNIYKQDGLEIHQGIELTGSGKLTDDLTFVGGFTGMDAHVSKAKAAPTTIGKTPVNVPEWQARAYLEYALPFVDKLTAIGGANYYGARPVNTTNTKFMPGATTVDMGLRYMPEVYGHPFSVNLMANNVFDKSYWAYLDSTSTGMMLGTPRVVTLSVNAKW